MMTIQTMLSDLYANFINYWVGSQQQQTDEGAEKPLSDADRAIRNLGIQCPVSWMWNVKDKSKEVVVRGHAQIGVTFHPRWSNGTAGVRGTRPLSDGTNYWEIEVGDRVFGTSLMFGVSTKQARLHVSEFKNLLGEDDQSWGLSHRGRIHHNGESRYYCQPFSEYTPVTVGILLDLNSGELTFFKDGQCLGLAFTGLGDVREPLYPTICSTAAKTRMSVGRKRRSFVDLKDRCRFVVNRNLLQVNVQRRKPLFHVFNSLPVPEKVKCYLASGL